MKIQMVGHWIKKHHWGPIPDEWFLLEGLTQAGLGRVVNLKNAPAEKLLPFRFGSDSKHEIYLEDYPKPGYDLSLFFVVLARASQLDKIKTPKVGITFDLPSFNSVRLGGFLEISRHLDLLLETCDEKLHCRTRLVRQAVRLGAPFLERSTRDFPVAFFGRTSRRPERLAITNLVSKFNGRVIETENGVHNENLWKLLSRIKVTLGAHSKANYWSNRIYKMIEVGGCFIRPYTQGLEKEFENWKHIAWSYSDEELESLLAFYLEHKEAASKMRYEAWAHAQQKLTYYHRGKEVIKILKEEGIYD